MKTCTSGCLESLVDALLNADPEITHVMEVPKTEFDRNLLASVLLKHDEELTPQCLEGAFRALRRIHMRRKLEQVQTELQNTRTLSADRLRELLQERTV